MEQKPSSNDKRLGARKIARFFVVLLLPVLMFVIAGRWDWWQGWVFLGSYLGLTVISRVLLIILNPDLAKERANFTEAQGAKRWDKKIAPLVVFVPLLALIVAALDFRLGWSPEFPLWLELAGLALLLVGYAFSAWAMLVNRYFSGTVRIQTDRGHQVISSGPYRLMRHPGYAGGLLADAGMPFLLGSIWMFVLMLVPLILLVVRTALEDRTLQEELPGYKEYAGRVRYRLFPGIW
jgi:protein-S-isoprenylcysteine O-methyltransferase Ste14